MRARIVACLATALLVVPTALSHELDVEEWAASRGTLKLIFQGEVLDARGLEIVAPTVQVGGDLIVTVGLDSDATLPFAMTESQPPRLLGRELKAPNGITLKTATGEHTVLTFGLVLPGDPKTVPSTTRVDAARLEIHSIKSGLDRAGDVLLIAGRELVISPGLAAALNRPELDGAIVGRAEMSMTAHWTGGAHPVPWMPQDSGGVSAAAPQGPDMAWCQLYGLGQYGRVGSIVGLSVATTSWNVGTANLPWIGMPSPDHPFIVWDMFRLKTVDGAERFEQIGQSWIKHGFCALDSEQCGTECSGTGCGSLGLGCTDTYSAGLNAGQGPLGPRFEVDPWGDMEGEPPALEDQWTYLGSHYQVMGSHSHDGIQHRCQVHDNDLNPALNPGAEYFCSGLYIAPEDVNCWNSICWKPTTVSGVPGGTWTFGMSGSATLPETGPPTDAWPGASKTILAQTTPVVEFQSPDGRCVLAAKSTDLGDGTWHYEYALFNLDMDRQVGSFSIPIPIGATVTNLGFHSVMHHEEGFNTTAPDGVPIDNAAWTPEVSADAVTWTTATNPLRWDTLYNFRFDADVEPGDVTVTLGLFRPGTPSEVSGSTVGPAAIAVCSAIADCADLDDDGFRDDNCMWWACEANECLSTPITFADMGGQFGECPPDGIADLNDRFHALNCFADQDTTGVPGVEYPCADNPPLAFNVDAGGAFGECPPDGVCDINDAFHAVNAFEGTTACSCPPGPAPQAAVAVVATTDVVLKPRRNTVRPGGLVEVDVYLDRAVPDLRGYQLHLGVRGGGDGQFELQDIVVDERRDSVFAGLPSWEAFNVRTGQLAVGLDQAGVNTASRRYLATFIYRASARAAGTFAVDLLHSDKDPTKRTFLLPTPPTARIAIEAASSAVVAVGQGADGRRAARAR